VKNENKDFLLICKFFRTKKLNYYYYHFFIFYLFIFFY